MKVRKSLSLILALVMVLSLFSFASAATFEDVPSDLEGAVARLVGLGIINGYPDGTFRPDNNITRAEFAKIAVIVLGLEKSADLLENVPSSFKDVKVGDWYNKYVNVAANQGILKGYPDGTFRPNNNITQAEALTIVLRIMGYKEEYLPGNWPYNYVTQADRIGLLDDSFATVTTATRGWIADLVSRALEVETVTVVDGEFQKGESLIKKSFGGQIIAEKRVVATLAASTGDTITVADADGKETTLNVAANAVINGAAFADLRNHMVDLTTKLVSGKEVVVAIDVLSAKVTGEVKAINNFTRVATIGTTEVVFGDGTALPQKGKTITAYIFLGKVYDWEEPREENYGEITDITIGASNTITINVKFEKVDLGPPFGLVPYTETYTVTKDTIITLNGAKATIGDLAGGEYVEYELDGTILVKLDAYSNVVFGTLEAWEMEGSKVGSITVNGVKYAVVESFDAAAMDEIPIGVTVMLKLNAHGYVYSIMPFGQYASTVIGEFDSLSSKASAEGQVYYIVLKDGTSYDITEAVVAAKKDEEALFVDLVRTKNFTDLDQENSTVKICYNAKGEVVAVYVFNAQTIYKADEFNESAITSPFDPPTYSLNGNTVYTLPSEEEVDRYVVTWNVEGGYAKHIDAIKGLTEGTITAKGTMAVFGNYLKILVDVGEDKAEVQYFFAKGAENYFNEVNIGDKVEFVAPHQNKIIYLAVLVPAPAEEPTTPPAEEDEIVYQGTFGYKGDTYVQINDVWYLYVGNVEDLPEEVGTKVKVTFAEFLGETVVISIESAE